jgi:hypothetical protein
MKTRQGFVSNSSSTSFLVVGYEPIEFVELTDKEKCEKHLNKRCIEQYAASFFRNDEDYLNPKKRDDVFWKCCAKNSHLNEKEFPVVPKGLQLLTYNYKNYIGLGFSMGDNYLEISLKEMSDSINKVQSLAPKNASIKIFSGYVSE